MVKNKSNQTCRLISAKTLAKMLGLSTRQIFRLNISDKLPAPLRIGGSLRWDLEEDIRPWLAAGAPDRWDWEEMKEAGRLRAAVKGIEQNENHIQ